jgi:hypothetical protein
MRRFFGRFNKPESLVHTRSSAGFTIITRPGLSFRYTQVLIVSGMPLLEEAYRFAELVLPHLSVDRPVETGVTSAFTKDRDAAWQKIA